MPSVLQPVVVTRCGLMWYHLRDCDGERTVTTSNLITVIFSPGPVLADAAVLLTDPFNYLGLTMLLTIEGGGAHCGGGGVWAGTQYHFLRCNLNLIHVLRSTFAADNGWIIKTIYYMSTFRWYLVAFSLQKHTYPQQSFKFPTLQMTVLVLQSYSFIYQLPVGVRIWFCPNCRVRVFYLLKLGKNGQKWLRPYIWKENFNKM